jgi:uncharacterized protein YdiU (UPF0061 family)
MHSTITKPSKEPRHHQGWKLENSYTSLPDAFYTHIASTLVKAPQLVIFNHALAKSFGLSLDEVSAYDMAQLSSGNALPEGSTPIAQAYVGHQFGHFTMLGDERTHLLGEQITPDGKRYDIQLKGSGQNAYSRLGDGRAVLAPMLYEYLISEAMHVLGIPTTQYSRRFNTRLMKPKATLFCEKHRHIAIRIFKHFVGRNA